MKINFYLGNMTYLIPTHNFGPTILDFNIFEIFFFDVTSVKIVVIASRDVGYNIDGNQ
jgi:hypothetical protein